MYSAEARTGNFRYLNGLPVSPGNVAANPSAIRTVNLLKPNRNLIDPTTAAQSARTQLPNNFDIGDGLNTGGFRFNAFRGAPRDSYSFRGDHHFSDKYSLEFNHSYGNDFQIGDLTNNRTCFLLRWLDSRRLVRLHSPRRIIEREAAGRTRRGVSGNLFLAAGQFIGRGLYLSYP